MNRNATYEKRSRLAYSLLKDIQGVLVNPTNGAFPLLMAAQRGQAKAVRGL